MAGRDLLRLSVIAEHFDVVVVGARCAGSPLAALLARQGVRVALVERATFPRETLSTHAFEADALAFLDRLGVTERLRATGAPFVNRVDFRIDDLRVVTDWPRRPGDIGGAACVRRSVLDSILAQAALEAGAEVRMATTVTGLVERAGRVAGVRVSGPAGEAELAADLLVGADGRNSTVARLCGSRRYNVTSNERFSYWTYFEGADHSEPTVVFHRWDDRIVLACPADSGLHLVAVAPDLDRLPAFRRDVERSFNGVVAECEPLADTLANAARADKFFGALGWSGYFREAWGPGWVLVGDAGHFKDPSAGRGIGDAFLQVESLAPAIVSGLDGSEPGIDEELARWARWRDEEFAEHYWFAVDVGRGGRFPEVALAELRRAVARGELERFMNLLNHRARPSEVVTRTAALRATGRLLTARAGERRRILGESLVLAREDARRRRLNRRPAYAAS